MSWTVSTTDDTGRLGGDGDYWYWKDQEVGSRYLDIQLTR